MVQRHSKSAKGFANVAVVIFAMAIVVAGLAYVGFVGTGKPQPLAQPSSSPSNPDISSWQTYRNEQYGFEVKYPRTWLVNYDEARIPDSNDSNPRFTISEREPDKDLQCYASFIFKELANPEKYTYSLFSEADKKQECQQVLDQVLSTFKFISINQ